MATSETFTTEEVARRMQEFERANRRDHGRFLVGAILVGLLLVALAALAAYNIQGWAVR